MTDILEPAQINDIIRLYLSGISGHKITQKLGLPRRVVYQCIAQHVRLRNAGRPRCIFKESQIKELIQRYLAGQSLKQISDNTGIERNVLRKLMISNGVAVRGRSAAERTKWQSIKRRGE